MSTGRQLAQLGALDIRRPVQGLAISPDGRTLADPRVGLWDLETARLLELESEESNSSSVAFSTAVAFSPVEAIVAMAHPATIRLWDAVTGNSCGGSRLRLSTASIPWPSRPTVGSWHRPART